MGALTLNTDLDSALHIMNYCLSSSSSPSVQSIFKYHIQCLEKKMLKNQKTVAVVSPLSVSNSFACLEVEHVEDECTSDFTSPHVSTYVKSREGPKKGSAGDSKKVVLNSLLIPFDVSKSLESINTEEPVLELQRSVTIKRGVKVPIKVQGPAFPIKVDALLDGSGATRCFMDKSWALVMVASYLSSSYLISASILSNLGALLISYLIYGCGLVSS